jgi:lipoprotein-anchoring transpeptidase ErfK/SrfK
VVLGTFLTAGWLTAAIFPAPAVVPAARTPSGPAADTVWIASAKHPVPVHSRPGGRTVDRIAARTPYGSRTRLWVRARRDGWLKVSTLETRDRSGWIAARGTRPAPRVPRRIVIDLSTRRLTVVRATGRWSTSVVIGGPASPTPMGTFQVTDRLPGRRFDGVYGAWILVLSAYGTPARTSRLAVHGVPPAASSLTESHGCIRVPSAALERLRREIVPGTPVRIQA